MSYGPFRYAHALIIGFILGSILFLIGDATLPQHDVVQELPYLLLLAGSGAAAVLLLAMAANYVIGRRFLELRDRIAAENGLPNGMRREDTSGFDLSPANARHTAEFEADRAA
jgi:hypothetical protein